MRKVLFFLMPFLLMGAKNANAQMAECSGVFRAVEPPHFMSSKAKDVLKLREICRGDFAVLYSGITKSPVFCAELISRENLWEARKVRRVGEVSEDASITGSEKAFISDYRGSGMVQAQCSSANHRLSETSRSDSFILSGIFPQYREVNTGIWAQIEKDIDTYAFTRASGFVYVVTGLFYKAPVQTIGKSKVWIPTVTYKYVRDLNTGKSWGVWLDNNGSSRSPEIISKDELEKRTGIVF